MQDNWVKESIEHRNYVNIYGVAGRKIPENANLPACKAHLKILGCQFLLAMVK